MVRKGALAVILLILVVAEGSDASLLETIRRMMVTVPKEKPPGTEITPEPSPTKDSDGKDPQSPLNDGNSDIPTASQAKTDEKCEGFSNKCNDKNMTACIRYAESGSQESFLIVWNEGENILEVKVTVPSSVNITAPSSVNIAPNVIIIPKHQAEKITFSMISVGENPTFLLNSTNGDCGLQLRPPVSKGNLFQWLPSYATHVTPIYGAYLLFLTALIVGGTWTCCKLGKRERRGDGGVQYQELEMGFSESVSGNNVDTATSWDQGWDDDWDEEKAVKSPGGYHVGNVSANGLTSRSSNKDGWEND